MAVKLSYPVPMAGQLPPYATGGIIDPPVVPQHFFAPSERELRAQAVHRLQVGLFGLCAMLLIVGLANIIMDRAKLAEVRDPIADVVAADEKPKRAATDALADIGVAPAADPSPEASGSDVTGPGARP